MRRTTGYTSWRQSLCFKDIYQVKGTDAYLNTPVVTASPSALSGMPTRAGAKVVWQSAGLRAQRGKLQRGTDHVAPGTPNTYSPRRCRRTALLRSSAMPRRAVRMALAAEPANVLESPARRMRLLGWRETIKPMQLCAVSCAASLGENNSFRLPAEPSRVGEKNHASIREFS